MTKEDQPLSRPLRVSRLSPKVPTTFDLTADAAERTRMARALGILSVERLAFSGTVMPIGRHDFTLQGQLTARVVQACVVTLQPVHTEVTGEVLRRYLRDYAEPTGDEVELQDDTVEPLPEAIDPGAVALEELALLLPEYPRAAGAVFDLPQGDAAEAAAEDAAARPKPFAGLADLAARMAKETSDPDEKDG